MPGVVLIGIDGLSAGLLADLALRLPALRGLAARGVAPARHGILGNEVFDRASGRLLCHEGDRSGTTPRVPTLWNAAAAAGLRTAAPSVAAMLGLKLPSAERAPSPLVLRRSG